MNESEFRVQCRLQGLELSDRQMTQFRLYGSILMDWNQRMNLTAITDPAEVWEKHFYDSLLPAFVFDLHGSLCDVGAGAGFPSVPMKIACPQLMVTMVEPLQKRIRFLQEVIDQLQLSECQCLAGRAEEAARDYRETFDVVTARAVAALPILAELCLPLVRTGGLFIAMKGPNGLMEDQQAQNTIAKLGGSREQIQQVSLSDGSGRINLGYRKNNPTDAQYPRAFGKIKKRPL